MIALLKIFGPLLGKIAAGPVLEIVEKLVPDADLKTRLKAEIKQSIARRDIALTAARRAAVLSELRSDSWMTRSWRPALMFLLMAFLLFFGLILPLMLAATLATFLAERFMKDSVYTLALKRRGITRTRTAEVDILDTVAVGSVMTQPAFEATPSMSIADLEEQFHKHRSHGVPVVDGGRLVGVVTITDISHVDGRRDQAIVGDVMTRGLFALPPETPLDLAAGYMDRRGIHRVLVMDGSRLVGIASASDFVRAVAQHRI